MADHLGYVSTHLGYVGDHLAYIVPIGPCSQCTTGHDPDQLEVTISGIVNDDGCNYGSGCTSFNDTFILTKSSDCVYEYHHDGCYCSNGGYSYIKITFLSSSKIRFEVEQNVNCALPDPNNHMVMGGWSTTTHNYADISYTGECDAIDVSFKAAVTGGACITGETDSFYTYICDVTVTAV